MSHSTFQSIDLDQLTSIIGGAAQTTPSDESGEGPQARTWGQMAREYAGACVTGAGQSFLYGGRPRNLRQGLTQAAIGCATGVGMRALDDLSNTISGNQGY